MTDSVLAASRTTAHMLSSELEIASTPSTFWETAAETRWGNYITRIERDMLRAVCGSFPQPGSGLEIGCEGGRWCRMLTDVGWQMTATDIDPDALALCQQRNPTIRCVLAHADDRELPSATASVDLLLCLEVPPLADQVWFYREAGRVLKPGGKLVGTLNNLCSWRGAAVAAKSMLLGRRHFYTVSFRAFKKTLAEHGIAIDAAHGCCWPPFGRHSDSRLVGPATAVERMLQLHKLPSISPWVVYTATRQ